MNFKTALSKKYLNIALSKRMYFKNTCQIAPSKDAFQNCYKLSIGNKNQNPVDLKTLDM